MNIVTLFGVFIVGALCSSTIALCRRSAGPLITENAVDASKASRRVNDLLTVLGVPLFHPKDKGRLQLKSESNGYRRESVKSHASAGAAGGEAT